MMYIDIFIVIYFHSSSFPAQVAILPVAKLLYDHPWLLCGLSKRDPT